MEKEIKYEEQYRLLKELNDKLMNFNENKNAKIEKNKVKKEHDSIN